MVEVAVLVGARRLERRRRDRSRGAAIRKGGPTAPVVGCSPMVDAAGRSAECRMRDSRVTTRDSALPEGVADA
ncbi:hypothetical protein GCM10022255_014780 [Dactylosporangium darangshiense]|uniref:Uncharacterized protein n=1 Tax=Dactylosporangium darangshiense TaxID=579108 RepID=A0ABP8D1N9_9ACTN